MSFVQKQLYPIAFKGGVDTKTDPKQVMAGNLQTLQNGLFNNTGELNKRSGDAVLSKTVLYNPSNPPLLTEIASAQAINYYNQEMLLFDGNSIYSYIAENETWVNKGVAVSTITSNKQIIRTNNAQQLNPDVNLLNGAEVYAWEDSRGGVAGSIHYEILDTVTQAIILADSQLLDGYGKPKVMTYNNEVLIFATDLSNNLVYTVIDVANPKITNASVTVANDGYVLTGSGTFSYDCAVINGELFCAYLGEDAGVASINLFSLNSSLVKSSVIQVATGATALINVGDINCVSVAGDSLGNIWVSWSNGLHVYVSYYNSSLTQILAPTQVDPLQTSNFYAETLTMIEWNTDGYMGVLIDYHQVSPANPSDEHIQSFIVEPNGFVLNSGVLYSVGLASKPYKVVYPNLTAIYVNIAYQSPLSSTYFTIVIYPEINIVAGKVNSGTGGGLRTNNMLPEIPSLSPGIFKFVNLTKGAVISEGNTIFTLLGVNSTTLNYIDPDIFYGVTQNENLVIAGGIIQIYDGISVVESNFHYPPEGVTAIVTGSGSGLATGQYQYQVTYEWVDNYGQIEVSTPSPILTIMVTAGQNVQFTIPTLRLTKKQPLNNSPRTVPTICVYRTAVNGTIFNEVTSILAPLSNVINANTVTFTDTLSDLSAASNRLLYTTGGVLNNVAPPAASLITLYQDRIVLSGLEDPNLLWFSQNAQNYTNYNTTPTNFAAELTIGCDPLGGPITAIKNLNQNLVIFKKNYIFIVSGDGPNNTGGGQSYPDPVFLTSDVGCSNPNSIAIIPANAAGQGEIGGLIFQSDKGIYMLDQSLNVIYIGAPVYAFNNLLVTSATLVSDQNHVIFTTSSATSLVYDYYVGQWSTFTNQNAIDAITFENQFTYVQPDGYVYQADSNSFTSGDGYAIEMSFTTPDFSFAQINGYQRVFHAMILGTYEGPHTLTVNVAYDYSPTYTQSVTINVNGTPNPTDYEFRLDFAQQVCTAIRLNITDNQILPYNQGYSISAITFEVGTLGGIYRVPSTQTFGTS